MKIIKLVPRYYVIHNLCTIMAGAEPTNLQMNVASKAINIKGYAFSLSNGDHPVAIRTDSVVVDQDSGIEVTLTIPALLPQRAVGIDILHGFEQ